MAAYDMILFEKTSSGTETGRGKCLTKIPRNSYLAHSHAMIMPNHWLSPIGGTQGHDETTKDLGRPPGRGSKSWEAKTRKCRTMVLVDPRDSCDALQTPLQQIRPRSAAMRCLLRRSGNPKTLWRQRGAADHAAFSSPSERLTVPS
jgi:hypothetical protein